MDGTVHSVASVAPQASIEINNVKDLKTGQVVKFRTPYILRNGEKDGQWEYARVGKQGHFHTASGKGNGYLLHVEGGGYIKTICQGQLDDHEIQLQEATPEETEGKRFTLERTGTETIVKAIEHTAEHQHFLVSAVEECTHDEDEKLRASGFIQILEFNLLTAEGVSLGKKVLDKMKGAGEEYRLKLQDGFITIWEKTTPGETRDPWPDLSN